MQKVSCPSCGAPVEFKSHASVMAVCGYCKTTVLKDADKVKDMGRMSDVLEDFSPIQIGTSGQHAGTEFTVIGRIQLRYPAGMWNEWYVMLNDGRSAWLSDASGQYTFTLEKEGGANLPRFEQLQAGRNYNILGVPWTAADVRTAECIGGQGELPFKVGEGWKAQLADLRSGKHFLTLDYSDSATPTVYVGESVTLEGLKCQFLRDDDTVRDAAGELKQKEVKPLSCPHCGSSVNYVPGVTRQIICPACRSTIDASTDVLQVIEAAERMEAIKTTVELGAKATIGGATFEVIGAMRCEDDETAWTEYLMYNPRAGFMWLIETDEGWQRGKVQDDWPLWAGGDTARLGNQTFKKLYDYTSEVVNAVGAFNWQVKAGDKTRITEFECGKNRLAAEFSGEELTWTWATPVPPDQIRAWFGKEIKADKLPPPTGLNKIAKYFLWGLLGFNAIPLLLEFPGTWLYSAFGAAAIWLPAKFLGSSSEKE